MKYMRLWKWSGMFLAATGLIHTLYALIAQGGIWMAIFRDGAVGAVGANADRSYALWFFMCGILLVMWGITLHYYTRQTQKPVPSFLGYTLLLFAAAGCIFEPVSGFWLLLPQALLMIAAGRKNRCPREAK